MGSWTMREGVVLVRELALFVIYLNVLLGSIRGEYQVVQGSLQVDYTACNGLAPLLLINLGYSNNFLLLVSVVLAFVIYLGKFLKKIFYSRFVIR